VPTEVVTDEEATELEPPLALVEAEHTSERTEATSFGTWADDEADDDAEARVTYVELEQAEEHTEPAPSDESTRPEFSFVDVDPFDATPESIEPVLVEEFDVEHSAAYADDLDAAIDEVLALGASAIHFSPQGEWHTVRARIDGLVRELGVVAKEDLESLVERVEASAAMRVDVVATKQGDKVILFPREQAGAPRVLAELGLTSETVDTIHSALSSPSGATVVCGPIGSGTTTTLYAALGALNTSDRVVASIEDPVERVLDGIDQTEVDPATGLTFADGLRTLLATDSDVILVGEIRDRETAGVALQAALDGRHILAGLRAPSAAAAIRRLTDLGIESSVLGGALTCVVAQRLVRRICTACRETYYASDFELAELGQPTEGGSPRLLARGRGCTACDGTGFRGRVGLFEILSVTEEVRALVCDGASAKKIHRAAVAAGMQTLHDDGVRLSLDGITTAAEVQRVLGADR
jgi:type II secretory ATPase GspE/PulE/Tfp pilus assembly ATPase PilB-like protein